MSLEIEDMVYVGVCPSCGGKVWPVQNGGLCWNCKRWFDSLEGLQQVLTMRPHAKLYPDHYRNSWWDGVGETGRETGENIGGRP